MDHPIFEDRFVAFVDILGFRTHVERAHQDPNEGATDLECDARPAYRECGPRREVWQQLADAAVQVATYAALLAREEEEPDED